MTTKPATPAALSWSGVVARRMARHALAEPATDVGPADIAGVLRGGYAQVLSAAELSIGRPTRLAKRTTGAEQGGFRPDSRPPYGAVALGAACSGRPP